jgi:hypothetical protein
MTKISSKTRCGKIPVDGYTGLDRTTSSVGRTSNYTWLLTAKPTSITAPLSAQWRCVSVEHNTNCFCQAYSDSISSRRGVKFI